ncbi:hypothetical protein [Halorussus sp. MSC15.2]|uniref:hypothetical protein n=1 Tax=Halorussus sp. MSC15.2 TaxID=2283638 RepID=UPI0013D64839|nr:hypothetical protein [Halorussus sp. MSC15.2]
MTVEFTVGDRFVEAAEEWGDNRMMDREDAVETKAEQALLEVEHLVSGATDVSFDVEGRTVRHEASDELAALLAEQSAETGLDESELLRLHVDLFSGAFREDDAVRPPNAPPE